MEEKKDGQPLKKSKKGRKNDDRECILYRRAGSIFDNLSSDLFKDIMKPEDEKKSQILIDLEKKAAEGDSEALNKLGCLYYEGNEVEQNYEKAVSYYRQAADLGNTYAINNLGICYYWGKGVESDMEKAAEYHRIAAEKGNEQAMNDFAYMFEFSLGVPYDMEECIKWHKKAAELGNVKSMTALGNIYFYGKGVKKNMQEAFSFFEAAAKKGNLLAKERLAKMYEKGIGVQQDLDKAKFYCQEVYDAYRAKALCDDDEAFFRLGTLFFNGAPLIGLKQDYGQAVKWYKKAASRGITPAQNKLGVCYYLGLGVGQNYQKAFYWYNQAALKDDVIATYNLCNCYCLGRGVDKDFVKAAELAGKAAERGYVEAYDTLGEMYCKGEGVEQNYQFAVKWYKKACEANVKSSFAGLGNCYRNGWYVSKDERKAFELYKQAADLGDLEGRVTLAECYIKGFGTGVDIRHAAEILEDICGEQEKYYENIVTNLQEESEQGDFFGYNPLDSEYLKHYAKAYYLLAKIYAVVGDGIEKDAAKSTRLLNIAENLGYKDKDNAGETTSDLRKVIADEAELESLPLQGRLIVKKHMCHNKQFGLYNFIYRRTDGSELTLKFSSARAKFIYLMTVLTVKAGYKLRPTMFDDLKEEMIQLISDLGVNLRDVSRDKWISKFYSDVDYKAGAYSTAGSNVNTCFKENMTLQDYEVCKIETIPPGGGPNAYKTIGFSPDDIDVDDFFYDYFMDAIIRVKKVNATE